jgi:putative ABC transport system permease protein
MILFKLALRNLARSRKNSLVLIALVAVGVCLFVLGDAILAQATGGIRDEFQNAYTGDIAIRAKFERKFGVFGFSMPMIGEYEEMPSLPQTPEVKRLLAATPGVESFASLVSGAALLEGPSGYQAKLPVFGVDGPSYFHLFPGLRFSLGEAPGSAPGGGEAWIVLPRSRADEIEKAEGRKLALGDSMQFTMASGSAFTIRAVRLAGIVETPTKGNEETAAVYTDPSTLRALLGLPLGTEVAGVPAAAATSDTEADLASMFAAPDTSATAASGPTGVDLVEHYLDQETTSLRVDPEKGAWHFVLVRSKPEVPQAPTLREINRSLKAAGIQAEAVDWLSVAGLNASLLFLLKTVFEIGIGVLAAIVVLVLTNGLAFSVMEQTREIGTMRAMGAQRSFVSRLYFLQSLLLVLAGAALGSGFAYLILAAIGRVGIPITNSYLFMLFGVSLLKPAFSDFSLLYSFAGAVVVAAAASLYPIHMATKLTVAQTMEAE